MTDHSMQYLDLNLMEKVCHEIAVAYFNKENDPIAPFSTCDISLLDSALNAPKQTFDGRDLLPGLIEKATALYYSLIKNHAFHNGNKRIATVSLLVFLRINGHWIFVGQKELADWAIRIAESKDRQNITEEFKDWLRKNVVVYNGVNKKNA